MKRGGDAAFFIGDRLLLLVDLRGPSSNYQKRAPRMTSMILRGLT
jgi:hypothetical protein